MNEIKNMERNANNYCSNIGCSFAKAICSSSIIDLSLCDRYIEVNLFRLRETFQKTVGFSVLRQDSAFHLHIRNGNRAQTWTHLNALFRFTVRLFDDLHLLVTKATNYARIR